MDDFWLKKAHQYIQEHGSFSNVGDIAISGDRKYAHISADVSVGLPARFIEAGATDLGVRALEPVTFKFQEGFPLNAPKIILRDDFPRSFPHINPSRKEVLPCIYEGDLSELLQQSEWMNAILNQLVDWLEKAASGSLLDYRQGWEPMRNDETAGFIIYDVFELLDFLKESSVGSRKIQYEIRNDLVVVDSPFELKKGKTSTFVVCQHPNKLVQSTYIPNSIISLNDLYAFSKAIGIGDLKETIEHYDTQSLDEDKIFVALAIHRPCQIINSDSNVELLNFVIHKSKPRKNKKRALPECSMGMLTHINKTSPQLLQKLSGSKHKLDTSSPIALIGCGSLGSKIGLHLARNGNCHFHCVDDDLFLPHNNARHGLSLAWNSNKADQLGLAIFSITGRSSQITRTSAIYCDLTKSRLIIDTTASFAVRSFLMRETNLPPVISCGIYGGGKLGISLVESAARMTRLDDLWATLYFICLERKWLREILFSDQKQNIQIGQGCSSHTVVMSDAVLSLFSAAMSLNIQKIIEHGHAVKGTILLARISNEIDLVTERIVVSRGIDVPSLTSKDWHVRILNDVVEKMKDQSSVAGDNETGGCVVGSVFLASKSIIITDILPPPPDSISTPTTFILGTEGLASRIKSLERKTNGKVTYLGTWHSHPHGGGASHTDNRTARRLLFVRNYEPTVCIIWRPDGIVQV